MESLSNKRTNEFVSLYAGVVQSYRTDPQIALSTANPKEVRRGRSVANHFSASKGVDLAASKAGGVSVSYVFSKA